MRIFNKISLAVLAVAFTLVLAGPNAFASTSPSLGTAGTYGVLTGTFNYNIGLTTITGTAGSAVLGVTAGVPGGGASLGLTGTTETATPAYTQAGIDQNNALNNAIDGLNVQAPCTSLGAIVDLASFDIDGAGPLPPGTFTPGCYSTTGAMNVGGGGTVTLSGAGTYIFRAGGAFNTTANSIVQVSGGASECNVFWAPIGGTTLGANSDFVGTVIDNAGITMLNNVTWVGRALAYAATLGNVTADTDHITVPTCAAPPAGGGGARWTTINVVKTVINDNGGTKKISDFPLFVNGTPVLSGATNSFRAPGSPAQVTETSDSNYKATFSGDCSSDGLVSVTPGQDMFCILTNNDIGASVVPVVPPLIDVVKVPNPLALPNGPGKVDYTYTLKNIGTVPVTDITMVGDTCSPIKLVSGDTNSDSKLDVNETWIYKCSWNLTETHTNTVVATGWANGISTSAIASATVIVGASTVHPLIHVTKIPSPLTLPAGGGMVTYTEKITNPGTVPLNNVRIGDDKCSPMKFISGDTNKDSKLDPTETWNYTCRTKLTETTTNTAIARGEANGFIVRNLALATVPVATMHEAAPKLPNTGVIPFGSLLTFSISAVGLFILSLATILIIRKKII
jgi:uncharacterized repeat protein (TIGR01451 family)